MRRTSADTTGERHDAEALDRVNRRRAHRRLRDQALFDWCGTLLCAGCDKRDVTMADGRFDEEGLGPMRLELRSIGRVVEYGKRQLGGFGQDVGMQREVRRLGGRLHLMAVR